VCEFCHSNGFHPPETPICTLLNLNISGGPTQETRGILNLSVQYWTSRGWAVVDVNYGGSTGLFLILSTTNLITPSLTVEVLDFFFHPFLF